MFETSRVPVRVLISSGVLFLGEIGINSGKVSLVLIESFTLVIELLLQCCLNFVLLIWHSFKHHDERTVSNKMQAFKEENTKESQRF